MQQELIKLIDDVSELEQQIYDKDIQICKKCASELLDVLLSFNNWKVMVKSCLEHIETYKNPKDFFKVCRVKYYSDHTIVFSKSYPDGEEYIVITIDLKKSIEQNIQEMIDRVKFVEQLEEEKQKEKDLKLYQQIKEKYNL